jgi:HEAT repeat protein
MKLLAAISLLVILSQNSFAAKMPAPTLAQTLSVKEALMLPLENRGSVLKAQGAKAEAALTALMFDKNASMDIRWRAVTAAGLLGGNTLKPQVEKALAANEWFIRNAGLIALESMDKSQAKVWAKKLLNDKALIVRSAAVDTLTRLDDQSAAAILWKKLDSKENFRGAQSLWIRKQITIALARLDKGESHGKFIGLLEDRDEAVQEAAIRALELRTGQKLGTDKEPVKFKRAYWQQWWRERRA